MIIYDPTFGGFLYGTMTCIIHVIWTCLFVIIQGPVRREFLFLFQSIIFCNLYDRVIPLPVRVTIGPLHSYVVGNRHALS